jgi:hypothetical protein
MKIRLLIAAVLSIGGYCVLQAQTITVQSPSKNISLQFLLDESGRPTYSVFYKGRAVIEPSHMGFELKDIGSFKNLPAVKENFGFVKIDSSETDNSWNPVWGEVKTIRNHYKELKLQLEEQTANKRKLDIVFRVFDDGIGFRYEFPQQPGLNYFIVASELTEMDLSGNHTAWWIPGDYDTNEYPPNTSKLSEVDAFAAGKRDEIAARTQFAQNAVQTPLMMRSDDGLYINIHEAALVNYPAMNLVIDKSNYKLTSALVPSPIEGQAAYLKAPCHTPWRTIIVSDKPTDILSSKMILNLNEPSLIKETSWIRPTKYVGIWWEMHVGKSSWDYSGSQNGTTMDGTPVPHGHHGATTARTKTYIDFAAKNGFGGVLVEGWNTGWEDWFGKWKEEVFDFVTPYPDYDLFELNRYAISKGVRIIMHHETSASVTNYERWMDTAYRLMNRVGSTAVKTGYVGKIIPRGEHHDGQWMINHYLRVAKKTADYHIMLVAHEPVRPTGLQRTYPNWMACEAARGNEFNAWSNGNMPEHETILPFTRLMGGPMDYTPGIFKIKLNFYDPKKKEQVHTTLAKQLALYVTLYSPVQMAADLPENYEAKPDAFQFIKDVAVDWDDTKYLSAEPGDYLTVARKAKGSDNWFVGAITDENARNADINLNFLDAGKKYLAVIYRDADNASWNDNPEAYTIEKFIVDNKTTLKIKLAEGGGCAISLMPAGAEELKTIGKYKAPKK